MEEIFDITEDMLLISAALDPENRGNLRKNSFFVKVREKYFLPSKKSATDLQKRLIELCTEYCKPYLMKLIRGQVHINDTSDNVISEYHMKLLLDYLYYHSRKFERINKDNFFLIY